LQFVTTAACTRECDEGYVSFHSTLPTTSFATVLICVYGPIKCYISFTLRNFSKNLSLAKS